MISSKMIDDVLKCVDPEEVIQLTADLVKINSVWDPAAGTNEQAAAECVARWADAWNTSGTLEEVATRDAILREHCAAVGRDPATIERTVSFPIVLRDDPADAARAFRALCDHNGTPDAGNVPTLLGPPDAVAAAIRPYVELGFATVIVRLPAPYDPETIARVGEVRAALAG
jgi:alkanesulfonate monooxygenase SsuD/methylene tetrahydromethanopterin reductase-like flavin-dependent oxidoreductase (luciferase family)